MLSDEFERIARIKSAFTKEGAASPASRGVEVDLGDDAAVLARLAGRAVLSVDASVEGVHFRRDFLELDVIVRRAMSAAVSDLAAMGAQPRAALCALILPATFHDDELDRLVRGFAQAAERYGCPVIGGNLARGRELSLTTTVIGEAGDRVLTRAGARPGDRIYVTGEVGAAALGLQLLLAGRAASGPRFVARYAEPSARVAEGLELRDHATAAIDVSDGVLQDLRHLCEASGVCAELEASALPLIGGHTDLASALGLDPMALALSGGDDYELLYTLPEDAPRDTFGTPIGVITQDKGQAPRCAVHGEGGMLLSFADAGYRHFAE